MFTDVKVRVFNIKWDTDGEDIEIRTEMELTVLRSCFDDVNEKDSVIDTIEEYIADEISNISGFCHDGFDYEIKSNIPFFIANYCSEKNSEIFQDYNEAKKESANGMVYKAVLNHNDVWYEKDLGAWNYNDTFELFVNEPIRIIEK